MFGGGESAKAVADMWQLPDLYPYMPFFGWRAEADGSMSLLCYKFEDIAVNG